ncbi:hypothetical protein A2165_04475 [Candidatus Curtissbacteria bacterium RBG_13_40_7]|uniref:Uncharacterized protein n=1 Tax=Candidatus Curtissbacteria bacterium RBG_13_40_7 TaxID=1797706 RepID=A0A1F5FVB7_9BACT|nr:MAG: hypothetical protein A2165_04475 [Candidatus Curtissbacteria bacterium RBG_13_40_7]
MEQSLLSRILVKLGIAILVIAFADLAYVNWWIVKSQESGVKSENPEQERLASINLPSSPFPSPDNEYPAPTSSPLPPEVKTVESKTIVEKESQTIVQTAQKEIFIPIGSGSNKNNSYEDLAGLAVTIDTDKYSAIDSVEFEASIWVQDGNGKMFAQLYNSTDKHPVWNSEISTSSPTGFLTTSPKITLDKGSRTYKVQAKTNMTSYAAHVDNARIKITLK